MFNIFLTVNYTVPLSQLLLETKHNKPSSAELRAPFRHEGFVSIVIPCNRLWGSISANRSFAFTGVATSNNLVAVKNVLAFSFRPFSNEKERRNYFFQREWKNQIYDANNLLTNSSHTPTKAPGIENEKRKSINKVCTRFTNINQKRDTNDYISRTSLGHLKIKKNTSSPNQNKQTTQIISIPLD